MSLDLQLVLKYQRQGDTSMLEDTAAGIRKVGEAADKSKAPVNAVADGVRQTAEAAPAATEGLNTVGVAVDTAGGKFTQLKTVATGALGGIAGALAGGALLAAFGTLSAAAAEFVTGFVDGSATVEEHLKTHRNLVAEIKGAYAEAEGAASSYGNASRSLLTFQQQQNVTRLGQDFRDRQSGLLNRGADFGGNPLFPGAVAGTPFEEPVRRLREQLREGKADIIAFRTEISNIASGLSLGDGNRNLAEAILGTTEDEAALQEKLLQATDLLKGLDGDAQAAATALGGTADKYGVLADAAAGALPALRETDALLKSIAANGGVGVTPRVDPIGPGPRFAADGRQVVGGSFAVGGFTGYGASDEVAGFVHGREYVFDAETTARIGVGNLDAIRRGVRGFAGGGYVGGASLPGMGSWSPRGELEDVVDEMRGAVRSFVVDLASTRNPLQSFGNLITSLSSSYLNRAMGGVGDLLGGLAGDLLGDLLGVGGSPSGSTGRSGGLLGGVTNIFNVETPSPRAFAESRAMVARGAGQLAAAARRHS